MPTAGGASCCALSGVFLRRLKSKLDQGADRMRKRGDSPLRSPPLLDSIKLRLGETGHYSLISVRHDFGSHKNSDAGDVPVSDLQSKRWQWHSEDIVMTN